jgi:hypothetical protein
MKGNDRKDGKSTKAVNVVPMHAVILIANTFLWGMYLWSGHLFFSVERTRAFRWRINELLRQQTQIDLPIKEMI